MSRQAIIVYGAGGHARVVIDILERSGRYIVSGVIDDDPDREDLTHCGYPILGRWDTVLSPRTTCPLILAIGDNTARKQIARRVESLGLGFAIAVHPASTVASDVKMGPGTVVMAHAVVNPGASVGQHVIINTGATVDHDCAIGNFAHVSPGVHLGGNVKVEALAQVGIGASVVPNVTIGAGSVIGAGAAVVDDIPPGVIAVGVPARIAQSRQ